MRSNSSGNYKTLGARSLRFLQDFKQISHNYDCSRSSPRHFTMSLLTPAIVNTSPSLLSFPLISWKPEDHSFFHEARPPFPSREASVARHENGLEVEGFQCSEHGAEELCECWHVHLKRHNAYDTCWFTFERRYTKRISEAETRAVGLQEDAPQSEYSKPSSAQIVSAVSTSPLLYNMHW